MFLSYLLHAGHMGKGIEFYMLAAVLVASVCLAGALAWPERLEGSPEQSRLERRAKSFD